MNPYGKTVTAVVEALAIAAGWAMLGLAVLVTFEIFARKFFAYSIQGADEIGGYALAMSTAVGFSYALIGRAHIRIDLLLSHLPYRIQAVLHVVAFLLLTVYAGLLAWRSFVVLMESYELRAVATTPLKTPLILPQSVWAAGLGLFAALCVFALCKMLTQAVTGRAHDAARQFGVSTVAEELATELKDLERRRSR